MKYELKNCICDVVCLTVQSQDLHVAQAPFSYQKFSPKIFCLPFGHMHGVLNITSFADVVMREKNKIL